MFDRHPPEPDISRNLPPPKNVLILHFSPFYSWIYPCWVASSVCRVMCELWRLILYWAGNNKMNFLSICICLAYVRPLPFTHPYTLICKDWIRLLAMGGRETSPPSLVIKGVGVHGGVKIWARWKSETLRILFKSFKKFKIWFI